MPVICSTFASWRRLFLSVRMSPKIANLSSGSSFFWRFAIDSTRSRNRARVIFSGRSLFAALSWKKVTWTLAAPMSRSAAAGSPPGGLRSCTVTAALPAGTLVDGRPLALDSFLRRDVARSPLRNQVSTTLAFSDRRHFANVTVLVFGVTLGDQRHQPFDYFALEK